ncbi:PAS domain S-box protein [Mucilaginibacter pallidiroseus]|uniref:histidine kinase n=1 Tax=Mucilaginibacter pallidiroseus TaxID=2599295 RepID=A0A563UIK5_9SPHI|nr:ATP-binding protein [Mucilaginibacter pallidiroseus]TWR31129.1 PAS domain S-box protein [Mucilaginibacter pallidiroseus]
MPDAPINAKELKRIEALKSYNILDTATEKDYDEITELAAAICGTPIALISFIDKDRQWFKSAKGVDVSETDRLYSFCAHAIKKPNELMQVEDAHADSRFKNNPLVTGAPHITFYAGMPLVDDKGHALGSLCVIDSITKKLNDTQRKGLEILASQVVDKLILRKHLITLESANQRVKRLNDLLKEKEGEAMQIIKNTPLAMALHTGKEMVIRFGNDLMLKAWGKTEAVFGLPFNMALPELAALNFPLTMQRCYYTGESYSQTEAHMSYVHNGVLREFYYNYSFTPLKSADGTVWGLLNTALDVTELVKNRLAIERAEEQLRVAVQSANLGTWFIDANTREFIPSIRLKEIFGFNPDDAMPYEAALNQIPEVYKQTVTQAVEDAISTGKPYDIEYPVVGFHDGMTRWVRATGKMFPGDETHQPNLSGTMLDITDRKLEEQRKQDFIGIVSHELKSPLTSLKGYLQILEAKAKKLTDVSLLHLTSKALSQSNKMNALITGFLDVARLGDTKIKLNRTTFDMADLVKNSESELLLNVSTHTVIYAPVKHTLVHADQDKIEQVVINFINNAIKYSPDYTTIKVDCVTKGSNAFVTVKDEGMGISEKDRLRVFERFYRAESKDINHISGFGIGLYICQEIIRGHGGKIGVDSQLGKGSTFWFEIPLADAD